MPMRANALVLTVGILALVPIGACGRRNAFEGVRKEAGRYIAEGQVGVDPISWTV